MMRVLAACEFSGVVRDAFRDRGHDAWSADLLPGEGRYRKFHYEGDLVDTMRWEKEFDLIIAFPPCTHLASSGARWFKDKQKDGSQQAAINFARWLIDYPFCNEALHNAGFSEREENI